jgi:thiamine-monophosphate kinase
VGAEIDVERLPLSPLLAALVQRSDAIRLVLSGGDDYELCFTIAPENVPELQRRAASWDCACTEIGRIVARPGLRCLWQDGRPFLLETSGYEHFR